MLRLVLAQKVLWIYIKLEMGAFCEDLCNFSLDSLDDSFLLLRGHPTHFLLDASLHLLTVLDLLTDGNFIACGHHRLDIVLQV